MTGAYLFPLHCFLSRYHNEECYWRAVNGHGHTEIAHWGSSRIPQSHPQTRGLICFSSELTRFSLCRFRRRVGPSASAQRQPLHLLPRPFQRRLKHAGGVCVQPGGVPARSGGAFRTSHDGRAEQGGATETAYGGRRFKHRCLLNVLPPLQRSLRFLGLNLGCVFRSPINLSSFACWKKNMNCKNGKSLILFPGFSGLSGGIELRWHSYWSSPAG